MKSAGLRLVLVVTAILGGLTLLYPAPAAACHCWTTPLYSTDIFQGTGGSCQAAESDVFWQGVAQADEICFDLEQSPGACHFSLEITSPCSGAYEISGKVRFGCLEC